MKKVSATNNQKPQSTKRLFFTGLGMGTADLVPGVSGGTIAFLFGIYDELLYTIKLVTGRVLQLLLKGRFVDAFKLIPFGFLIPLGAGMLIAIFGFVHIISYLLETYPVYIWALFFGLIIGAAYIVSRRVTNWTAVRILLFITSLIGTYLLLGLPGFSASTALITLFATGAVAIVAMILPGISGSLIMVILGQYETVINAVAERNIAQLLSFAAGAALGIALFARLLSWLLHNYHAATIAVLTGILLGSLRRVWPWHNEIGGSSAQNFIPAFDYSVLLAITLMIAGFILVWLLEKQGLTKEHIDIDDPEFKKFEKTKQNY